jgi:hypothetical protein
MDKERQVIFNSPVEVALRIVFILNNTAKPLDIHRLEYYTYLLVHSSDIPKAPKSIHADLPKRSNELTVNQEVVKKALTLLISKGLISVNYSPKSGIEYLKNENTITFVNYFESPYSILLKERADWLCTTFDSYNDKELADFINRNIGIWGSEFITT